MKGINFLKIKLFSQSIWNAVSGIALEVAIAYFFIFVGFLVSVIWWRILK